MVVAALRAVWFVVSLPFRALSWFVWLFFRAGYAVGAGLVREFGQRNFVLVFAAAIALVGVGLLTGFIDCTERRYSLCPAGWETLEGLLFLGFGLSLAVVAVRYVPNDRTVSLSPDDDALAYPFDWRLSWGSVLFLAFFVVVMFAALTLR